MNLAIDFITPKGHANFNDTIIKKFKIDIYLKKNYLFSNKCKVINFYGLKSGFGWNVRLERLIYFPIIFILNMRLIFKAKNVYFLSYDFYSEPFLIFFTSLFKNTFVIHHGTVDIHNGFLNNYIKKTFIKYFFYKCNNIVLIESYGSYLKSLGSDNISYMRHPFTINQKIVDSVYKPFEKRINKFAMLSRSDDIYSVEMSMEFEKINEKLLTRSDFKNKNVQDPVEVLCDTQYFIFWEVFDYKVSGWVYDAIQCGCNIVIRDSKFAKNLKKEFQDKIHIITSVQEINKIV